MCNTVPQCQWCHWLAVMVAVDPVVALSQPLALRDQGQTRVKYVPSAFEQVWTDTPRKGIIRATQAKQLAQATEWTGFTESAFAPGEKSYPRPAHSVARHMSHFEYYTKNTKWRTMIEPLTGVGRHPLWQQNQPVTFRYHAPLSCILPHFHPYARSHLHTTYTRTSTHPRTKIRTDSRTYAPRPVYIVTLINQAGRKLYGTSTTSGTCFS